MSSSGLPLLGRSAQRALDERFAALVEKVLTNRPGDDVRLLRQAYEFAGEQHQAQVRESGEPFLSHPIEVAHILADMKLDVTTLCAALLHDVVEDTKIPTEQIAAQFGPDAARLVEGTTKIGRLDFLAPEERQAENVRKMLLAMVDDVRVVVVKLADRLHNMRTLKFLEAEKQQRIAQETLDIYAPIAHRLGMGRIRGELEDLAFSYLETPSYLELQKKVQNKRRPHDKFLAEVQAVIGQKLVENSVPAEVEGRVKRLYSIHLKLDRGQRALDQIYDLLAVRVITDSVKNCYAALGVIHQIWRPVPGRFKDYIAMPRPNLYQSLHTTVIHAGQAFEVQLRTQEMHRVAEQGVAAHWKYKDARDAAEAAGAATPAQEQRIQWMRQLIEWVGEMQEPGEFLATLKVDLYPEEVYTFTPKGRVIALARGATPVDFAYTVHTEVGHQCIGAKVNGQIVPLRHALANGDVVEVLTQKGHGPSRDWLNFVATSRAKSKIRHSLNVQEQRQATEMGRHIVEQEARQFGVSLRKITDETWQRVASDYGCNNVNDLYAGLGYGKWPAKQVLARVTGELLVEKPEEKPAAIVTAVKRALGIREAAILVRGHDDLLAYRAQCCNPIRGDEIIGYITRGRGVAVHTKNCPNVEKLLYQSGRRIVVEWAGAEAQKFPVRLLIRAEDKPGMLASVTAAISSAKANIRTLETAPEKLHARMEIALEIEDRKQLEKLVASIKKLKGVFEVERLFRA